MTSPQMNSADYSLSIERPHVASTIVIDASLGKLLADRISLDTSSAQLFLQAFVAVFLVLKTRALPMAE